MYTDLPPKNPTDNAYWLSKTETLLSRTYRASSICPVEKKSRRQKSKFPAYDQQYSMGRQRQIAVFPDSGDE